MTVAPTAMARAVICSCPCSRPHPEWVPAPNLQNLEVLQPSSGVPLRISEAALANRNTLTNKQIHSATTKLFCKKRQYTLMGLNEWRYAVWRESS